MSKKVVLKGYMSKEDCHELSERFGRFGETWINLFKKRGTLKHDWNDYDWPPKKVRITVEIIEE